MTKRKNNTNDFPPTRKEKALSRVRKAGGAYKHTRNTSGNIDASTSIGERSQDSLDRLHPNREIKDANLGQQAKVAVMIGATLIAAPQIFEGAQWIGEQIDESDPANHMVIPDEVRQLPANPSDMVVHVD